LAFCTASTEGKRRVLMHRSSKVGPGWFGEEPFVEEHAEFIRTVLGFQTCPLSSSME
jgi:hypothetical protein